jgi:hypothetical protein
MPRGEEERTANNAIYLELLGPGGFYSVNYDRAFGDFAGRIGFSYMSISASTGLESASASWLGVPLTFSYLGIGSKNHMLEVGAGVTLWSFGAGASAFGAGATGASALLIAPTGVFGYRMQPKDGGFFFKAGLSPIFLFGGDASVFWPAPHIGLGGTF